MTDAQPRFYFLPDDERAFAESVYNGLRVSGWSLSHAEDEAMEKVLRRRDRLARIEEGQP
jgi:hypothetical protein